LLGPAIFCTFVDLSFSALLKVPIYTLDTLSIQTFAQNQANQPHPHEPSEMKQGLLDAQSSNERLLLAIQGSGDGVWDWDIQTDVAYFSPRFREMVGAFPEDAKGLDALAKNIHPEDMPATMAAIQAHFEKKAPFDHEYRLLSADGAYRWYLAMGQAVWDETGKPIRMAGLLSDITPRKEMEVALRQSEINLNYAQEMAQLGSWVFTPATSELIWSDELFRIFEIEKVPVDQLYAAYRAAFHPDDLYLLDEVIQLEKAYTFENRIICKDGKIKYVMNIGDFVRNTHGKIIQMKGTAQDITLRKMAENNRIEYLQMLEELLFSLSHKIRKPVANIQAIVQLLDGNEKISEVDLKTCLGYLKHSNQELDSYIHEMNNLLAEKKRQLK
jgi:PAS domain S-box-containing protein